MLAPAEACWALTRRLKAPLAQLCRVRLPPSHSNPGFCARGAVLCSMLPAISQVAATLHFNPNLEYLADRVVTYITRDGRRRFNGAPAPRSAVCAVHAAC